MITLCHAAKGGSGTSVVAAIRATGSAAPTLLVDLEGDLPAILGVPEAGRPGVADWLESDAPSAHLHDLLIDIAPGLELLPAAAGLVHTRPNLPDSGERWALLDDWLRTWAHDTGGEAIIDAGTSVIPPEFVERCAQRWLVTRACYLSLRRATRLPVRPTGIVLIAEPGRGLGARDIEAAVGAPVIATIDWNPKVAQAIDTGLLLSQRIPRSVQRSLARAAA